MLVKMIVEYEWNKVAFNGILSAIPAFAAIFCVSDIVRIGMGEPPSHEFFSVAGLITSVLVVWFLAAFLCFKRRTSKTTGFAKSLGRVTATLAVLLCGVLLISLICGIMASLLYAMLSNVLTLGQIKGVVNLIATIVTLFGVPFMLSVFWSETKKTSVRFFRNLIGGLRLTRKQYAKLLISLLVLFGIGLLITTAYHYLPDNLSVNISKAVLLTILGTIGLSASDKICE